MKTYTLSREGNFCKGNLHTHTTISDGKLPPDEVIARYKKNGFNFLAISDHMVYGYYPEFENENFLSIPAAEIHTLENGVKHHLLAFGDPLQTKFVVGKLDQALNQMDVQTLIDYIGAQNNLVFYCHPYWSRAEIGQVASLKNIVGIEIYNHECEIEWRSGNAEVFFEHLWWRGNQVWCFGTDDSHARPDSFCGGYITVKTADFSHRGILEAIEKGSFFASSAREGEEAPKILDFFCEDGIVKLWCDPCRDLYFYFGASFDPKVWAYSFKSFHSDREKPITYAEYEIPENARYVKASIADFSGYNSWCQPILLK